MITESDVFEKYFSFLKKKREKQGYLPHFFTFARKK